ncbi:MAG: hypothetical protein GX868_09440 [Actinobacteria bacterium]|nr:hypothetical protein [Actinomycetota bacterium]
MSSAEKYDVVLVSCDPAGSFAQRDALVAEFEALHCSVDVALWDEQRSWADTSGIVIASPFNDAPRHDEFVSWLESVSAITVVINPAELVAWGSHRRYLFDLEAAGVPIVATRQIAQHAPWQFQRAALRRFSGTVVMKPAVASSSFGFGVFDAATLEAQAHLEAITLLGDVVIQPHVSTVDTVGVSQVVVLGGDVCHAVRKLGAHTVDHTLQSEERQLVAMVIDALPQAPIAACLELVWVGDQPALLSCDLVGPDLHAEAGSPALRRFARLAIDTIHAPKIDGIVSETTDEPRS